MSETDPSLANPRAPESRRLPSPGCLLAVTLVLSLSAACLYVLWRASERRVTLHQLEQLGGRIETEPARPVWLHDLVADKLGAESAAGFTDVTLVDLSGTHLDDDALPGLAGCNHLRELILDRTSITNNGLQHLHGLGGLRKLSLINTEITDNGLRHLSGLRNLQELSLNRTQVSDAGLGYLTTLDNLQTLSLRNTQITDAGLSQLQALADLRDIAVGNDISFSVFVNLSPMTRITDAGLEELGDIRQLRTLDVVNTQVTEAGIRRLQAKLPVCRIDSSL